LSDGLLLFVGQASEAHRLGIGDRCPPAGPCYLLAFPLEQLARGVQRLVPIYWWVVRAAEKEQVLVLIDQILRVIGVVARPVPLFGVTSLEVVYEMDG
jgi:hypothetical protein